MCVCGEDTKMDERKKAKRSEHGSNGAFFNFHVSTYSKPTSAGRLPSSNLGRAMNGSDLDISLL